MDMQRSHRRGLIGHGLSSTYLPLDDILKQSYTGQVGDGAKGSREAR